ncbi:hypothetical protein [Sorangium sp. So ce1389]
MARPTQAPIGTGVRRSSAVERYLLPKLGRAITTTERLNVLARGGH